MSQQCWLGCRDFHTFLSSSPARHPSYLTILYARVNKANRKNSGEPRLVLSKSEFTKQWCNLDVLFLGLFSQNVNFSMLECSKQPKYHKLLGLGTVLTKIQNFLCWDTSKTLHHAPLHFNFFSTLSHDFWAKLRLRFLITSQASGTKTTSLT